MRNVSLGSLRDQSTVVADQINWIAAVGDYWALAGLQGSGKSDFLMLAAGLMPPIEGSYRLFGEDMPIFDEARLKKRLRLGLVFETGQLFNHLTVRENIALPLRYHENLTSEAAQERVRELMDCLELSEWADSTPGAIGRNWAKRVGLARALVLRPEILLVDNPLGGLDLKHANWWLAFLDELSKGHKLLDGLKTTLVVTTADLRLWSRRARQFAILREKRFTVLGAWDQVEAANSELVSELLPIEQNTE